MVHTHLPSFKKLFHCFLLEFALVARNCSILFSWKLIFFTLVYFSEVNRPSLSWWPFMRFTCLKKYCKSHTFCLLFFRLSTHSVRFYTSRYYILKTTIIFLVKWNCSLVLFVHFVCVSKCLENGSFQKKKKNAQNSFFCFINELLVLSFSYLLLC